MHHVKIISKCFPFEWMVLHLVTVFAIAIESAHLVTETT